MSSELMLERTSWLLALRVTRQFSIEQAANSMLVAFHNAKRWDVHHRPPTSTKQATNTWLAFHNAKNGMSHRPPTSIEQATRVWPAISRMPRKVGREEGEKQKKERKQQKERKTEKRKNTRQK